MAIMTLYLVHSLVGFLTTIRATAFKGWRQQSNTSIGTEEIS